MRRRRIRFRLTGRRRGTIRQCQHDGKRWLHGGLGDHRRQDLVDFAGSAGRRRSCERIHRTEPRADNQPCSVGPTRRDSRKCFRAGRHVHWCDSYGQRQPHGYPADGRRESRSRICGHAGSDDSPSANSTTRNDRQRRQRDRACERNLRFPAGRDRESKQRVGSGIRPFTSCFPGRPCASGGWNNDLGGKLQGSCAPPSIAGYHPFGATPHLRDGGLHWP